MVFKSNNTTKKNPLLLKLKEAQINLSMTNEKFAHHLNISTSLWSQTRTGVKPINISVLSGVLNKFPEMQNDVIRYLMNNHHEQT